MTRTQDHVDAKPAPLHQTPEGSKGPQNATADLWLRQPENQAEDSTVIAARLCSCSDVCLASIEDL
ncbi:MAG TPA: hypothetical protein VH394_31570 [Thermoanaerobaculia bacterium]|jgi:hypothetical protein|nr:hypothetical protein [Thermoanaerobaculia bacterium]